MGNTLYSLDGKLKKYSEHVYSTNNAIHKRYRWLQTLTDVKWNSILEQHTVATNGTHILTKLETNEPCEFKKGHCFMKDKVMVWLSTCFYNLKFLRSEICHHNDNEIFCSETDFDVNGNSSVCGLSYISTKQGLLLSVNATDDKLKRHHRLNAAVIQHLENRIDSLEAKVMCLANNLHCEMLNDTNMFRHQIFGKFESSKRFLDVEESSINILIKRHVNELMNNKSKNNADVYESKSFLVKLGLWFSNFMNWIELFLTIGIFFTLALLLYCIWPHVVRILKCCFKRRQDTARDISEPIPLHTLSRVQSLHRYRSMSDPSKYT